MIYVRIGDHKYPATIDGLMKDYSWDERESKTIKISSSDISILEALNIFVDDAPWEIVQEVEQTLFDENGNATTATVITEEVYDNSDYSVAGPISDDRNGSIIIKMGKPTDLELAYEELYG